MVQSWIVDRSTARDFTVYLNFLLDTVNSFIKFLGAPQNRIMVLRILLPTLKLYNSGDIDVQYYNAQISLKYQILCIMLKLQLLHTKYNSVSAYSFDVVQQKWNVL